MKQYCLHHPTRPAHWHCDKCNHYFCSSCIVKRERNIAGQTQPLYLCPKCMIPANWIGAMNLVEPFWQKLPKFFTYPLALRSMALLVTLALIGSFFSGPGLINGLIKVAAWGVMIKYAYAALKRTAKGDMTPPKIDSATLSEDFHQVFKQFGIFITIGVVFVLIAKSLGGFMAIIFLIASVLSIPAMIIILVTTDSLISSINPMLFIQLAVRIGWGYLLMYFFLILLGGAPAVLAKYIYKILPLHLTLFIFSLAKSYYTLISYHLMGYVMLQYHKEVGYKVEFEDFCYPEEEGTGAGEDNNNETIDQINFLIKEGKHEEALAFIQDACPSGDIDDLKLSEYYYKLLKMKQHKNKMLEHAKSYLNLLINDNKKKTTCEVYLDCLAMDHGFTPPPSTLFKIGVWLGESGKSREAIGTFNSLIKKYPENENIPNAFFRAAQIYNDRLMNPGKAKAILEGILKKFPDHDIASKAENYLSHIQH